MAASLCLVAAACAGFSQLHGAMLHPQRCAVRPAASRIQMLSAQEAIETGVSLTTFAPQPFWVLLIAAPRADVTRKIMGTPLPILALSLVHFAVVLLAATREDGTAPIMIFADVFDPAQSQLAGMQRLFEVPNFVAEEWPHGAHLYCEQNSPSRHPAGYLAPTLHTSVAPNLHMAVALPALEGRRGLGTHATDVRRYVCAVLIWDLFVGRAIWIDGLARGVPTAPSVLLTNLIGPPGLLLHVLISVATGKGLPTMGSPPPADEADA